MLRSKINLIVLVLMLVIAACNNKKTEISSRVMPGGTAPEKLYVFDIPDDMSWESKNLLSCFQGLVNRKETRIYYNISEPDKFWLGYYRDKFNIKIETVNSIDELLKRFAGDVDGYIIYPESSPHLLNVATTIGSLENLLPATKYQEEMLQKAGLQKKRELKDEGKNLIEIYREAAKEWLPKCNKKLLAALCVHKGQWPTSTWKNRDYVMSHKVFSFDLSSSERDKADYNLLREIYSAQPEGAVIFGWHCARDKEHEAIALAAEFGHYGMCNLNTANMTVHSSIPVDRNKVFAQRKINPDTLEVKNKVYIASMATDGDAAWFMLDHVTKDWADPAHGTMKYNWGFLPLAYDLMPGTVQYYMENRKENDYFVCGPAGATYTYPYLHPHPDKFLKMSNEYMKKCGLTTAYICNWNDRDWWQEVDVPGFYDRLKHDMPDAVGFVRGMGESAFEKHFLGNGQPFLFCGEGIHKGNDVYQVLKDFIDACPNRPLFVFNLVNHSVPMSDIKAALDSFPDGEVEAVHLDELLLLADKAFKEGKVTADLYPDKEGLKEIMIKEAKQKWLALLKDVQQLTRISSGTEEQFSDSIRLQPIGLEPFKAGEVLLFNTIWYSMSLVKIALESKGIYVNNKHEGVTRFMSEFTNVEDAAVIEELQQYWDAWHNENPSYEEAQLYIWRLNGLALKINN